MADGKTTAIACKEVGITEQTYYGGVRSTAVYRWIGRGG
jgi:hypothetical protein